MSTFHKPKVYRSTYGCCICKAKSSSSRFTDSKKYESEFDTCFRLVHRRCGEICNACVLLVKRWRKLPPGTNRDWHHVVDAKAGNGTKSLMKFKSNFRMTKRLAMKNLSNQQDLNQDGLSDDVTVGDDCHSDQSSSLGGLSVRSRLAQSPAPSDASDDSLLLAPAFKTKLQPLKNRKSRGSTKISSMLDMSFWKKEKICCGTIFKGPNGQVLLDPRMLKPCGTCKMPSSISKQELEGEELADAPASQPTASVLPRSKCRLMVPSTVLVCEEEFPSSPPQPQDSDSEKMLVAADESASMAHSD